jgi:putative phage-type endonuclease
MSIAPAPTQGRASGIGASESAPIVLGQDRHGRTALDIYAAKVIAPRDHSNNEVIARGRMLEPAVLGWYTAETGRCPLPGESIVSAEHPWLFATPDGLLEDRVVEAKTSRSERGWGAPRTDQIPTEYLIQTHHQMLVTGRRMADVPVLFGGLEFAIYHVQFDTGLGDLILTETERFWREHVLARVPPAPRTGADCEILYARDNGATILATAEVEAACRQLAVLREQLSALEANERALLDRIQSAMGPAASLAAPDGTVIATWRAARAYDRLDIARLRAEHPVIWSDYKITQPGSRRFVLKWKAPEHEHPILDASAV